MSNVNAKKVEVHIGAMSPPNEQGQNAHKPDKWYFRDEGYFSPVPMSPAFDTEVLARVAAREYAGRYRDRVVES